MYTKFTKKWSTALTIVLYLLIGNSQAAQLLFWQAAKDNQTVYLLGSIHIADASFYPMPSVIESSFNEADSLVVEANIEDISLPRMATLIAGFKKQPLSSDLYQAFSKLLQQVGISEIYLEQIPPTLLAMQYTLLQLSKQGYSQDYGIDRYFLRKAKQLNKPIQELESIDAQFALLQSLDPNEMVKSTIEESKNLPVTMTQMANAWKQGDVSTLEKLVLDPMEAYPDLYQKMLVERNQLMLQKIQQYIAAKNTAFIVVGAAHLIGKDGLLTQLDKLGFNIRQY